MATLRTSTKPVAAATVKTTTTTKAEVTTEVKLATSIKAKLMNALRAYAEASQRAKEAKAEKETATAVVRKIRETTGASSISVEGFTMTNVPGESFDRDATYKKLMAIHGLTIEDIKACEVYKPKKAFEKITCPGEKSDDE